MNHLIVFIAGLLCLAILVYRYWKRRQKTVVMNLPLSASSVSRPSSDDKLIVVSGCEQEQLHRVLHSFCKTYQDAHIRLRLTAAGPDRFVLTFPAGIAFSHFCFLVNYLDYPVAEQWTVQVNGWATVHMGDDWITEELDGQQVMLYVPVNDTEYDQVQLVTAGNTAYKLGFSKRKATALVAAPDRSFAQPPTIPPAAVYEDIR